MPVTKEQAMTVREFHYVGTVQCAVRVGVRGRVELINVVRYRANGACQTWKTRPDEFRLPLKHGLYAYGEVTHACAHEFHAADECPAEALMRNPEALRVAQKLAAFEGRALVFKSIHDVEVAAEENDKEFPSLGVV